MQLKSARETRKPLVSLSGWPRFIRQHPRLAFSLATVFSLTLLGITALASLYVGAVTERRTGLTEKLDRVWYQEPSLPTIAMNYLGSFSANPERIVIDIKHKHYVTLAAWRQQALERKQITSDLKVFVPASIRYKDQTLDVKIRFKGEWTDHLKTDKWSFRVIVKDGNLFGMREFSLQHPETRRFIYEWLYLNALAREDIASLRYRFVNVTVNGRDLGVFALEEAPAKQLVEHNQRREGIVLRFNADYNYEPFANRPGRPEAYALAGGLTSETSSNLSAFDVDEFPENPELLQQFLVARNLLEAVRRDKRATSEVFDIERLATYFAISELTGALGTAPDWSDINFLYNPVSSRIEPVGKEGLSAFLPIDSLIGAEFTNVRRAGSTSLHTKIFSDPAFFRAYVEALERVSQKEYIDQLLADLGPEMQEQERILHREWPQWYFSRKRLDENAQVIRSVLAPREALHAHLADFHERTLELDLGVIQYMPLEVLGVSAGSVRFDPDEPIVVPGKARQDLPSFKRVAFHASSDVEWTPEMRNHLQLDYRLLGTSLDRATQVFPWRQFDQELLVTDLLRKRPNAHQWAFIHTDEEQKELVLRRGDWTLDHDLILPAGYRVVADEGVRLDLVNSARILSYSPLIFQGTEEHPIEIDSTDKTGQGIAVLGAREKSIFKNTVFRNLSAPKQGGWQITGAVTFYESPVDFERCEFIGNDAEDSLNIIRSEFAITHTAFSDTPSDALDVDFSTGRILYSTFNNIQGDAMDFSGSRAEIEAVHVRNVNDKGLSIGEASYLNGRDVEIFDARVGIAVKDLSQAEFSRVTLTEGQIGLAVYRKKLEYGPATLTMERLDLTRIVNEYLVESGSRITVSGRAIPENHANVVDLVDGVPTSD